MDIIEFSTPKVLFIKGVFIKDCTTIDDLFDEQILDQAHDDIDEVSTYMNLPTVFYSLKKWPKQTNIHCFYCDLQFEGTPVFIPKTIVPSKEGFTMGTEGCFCGFNCGMSHIDLFYPKINDNVNKKNMLKLLFKVFTGKTVSKIENAPLKYKMVKYGGMYSFQDYKNAIKALVNSY
jgi:hypothetical protein